MRRMMAMLYIGFFCLGLAMWAPAAWSQSVYGLSWNDILKVKGNFDDPSALYEELPPAKTVPQEVMQRITYDQEAMKSLWADVVGFKAPDIVGKIAPEIVPGTYTYQDKGKYPGLKELMIPQLYDKFAPGAVPHAGNFPEITVVPTKQYYHALPYGRVTKEQMGTVKQFDDGYLDYSTYKGAFPFPRPSGPHKAQQIVYNHEKRYTCGESYQLLINNLGYNGRMEQDLNSVLHMHSMRVEGRCLFEPLGYFDERAEKEDESRLNIIRWQSPRDLFGMAYLNVTYDDPEKPHLNMMYIPAIRRVRRMSGTDVQDPLGGQDMCADDGDIFNQKLSSKHFPYEYKLIEEREFLVFSPTTTGKEYLSSKGFEWRDYEFERRPMWAVELTQKDPNYIYSKRVIYFDREHLTILFGAYYDQKGRLYRTLASHWYFDPKSGIFNMSDTLYLDYVDSHSTVQHGYVFPDSGVNRESFSMRGMIQTK